MGAKNQGKRDKQLKPHHAYNGRPAGISRAPRPKTTHDGEEENSGLERRSARTRKAVNKFGGVAIDAITMQRVKRERDEAKTIFDEISSESDEGKQVIPNDDIQIVRVKTEEAAEGPNETEKESEKIQAKAQNPTRAPDSKRNLQEPVSEERAHGQMDKLDEAKELRDCQPPFTYKGLWCTEKDLENAEEKPVETKPERVLKHTETRGSSEFTGRYEQPESMAHISVP